LGEVQRDVRRAGPERAEDAGVALEAACREDADAGDAFAAAGGAAEGSGAQPGGDAARFGRQRLVGVNRVADDQGVARASDLRVNEEGERGVENVGTTHRSDMTV